jgi:hypothetical protein
MKSAATRRTRSGDDAAACGCKTVFAISCTKAATVLGLFDVRKRLSSLGARDGHNQAVARLQE